MTEQAMPPSFAHRSPSAARREREALRGYRTRVTGFGGLEAALRHHRSEPSAELLAELVSWAPSVPAPPRRSVSIGTPPRPTARVLTLAFVLVTIALFAVLGGVGYAGSGIATASSSVRAGVADLFRVSSDPTSEPTGRTSAGRQFEQRVVICHRVSSTREVTLRVSGPRGQALVASGDTLGPCE